MTQCLQFIPCLLTTIIEMQQKERRALDRCFDELLRDLDPSTSFLHSLYAENVLTEEQIDRISVSKI